MGDQDCLVKKGRDVSNIGGGGVYRKGGKHCFSLVMYGFCSSNVLYSASLSFRMFIIISDLSLVLLIKVLIIKKHLMLFFSLLKMKK